MIEHAQREWPREAVGALIDYGDGGLTYQPLRNQAENPQTDFVVPRQELLDVLRDGVLHGIHHSHPRCSARTGAGLTPSHHDMVTQLAWAVPFYITCLGNRAGYKDFFGWGDQLVPPPLKHRVFRDGVTDCYSLFRHATYQFTGLVLPDGPREPQWWDNPEAENPITSNLDRAGFKPVDIADLTPGDGLLFTIKGSLICHCGVYIGGDLFLHHLHGRLSKVDLLPQWRRLFQGAVRYAPGAENGEQRNDGSHPAHGAPTRAPC